MQLFKEIKQEVIEVIIFFLILFWGLLLVDIGNKELIREQAVFESQFSFDFEIPDGFDRAMVKDDRN